MKSVLFIDKDEGELWDAYERHSYLLDEWLHSEDAVVCPWYRDGRSVESALPNLEGLLGDEQEWEALVVCDLREKGDVAPQSDESFGNPFDFPEYYNVDFTQPIAESKRPIIRLTQMLGGIPDRVAMVPRDTQSIDETWDGGMYNNVNAYDLSHPRSDDFFELQVRYRLGLPRPRRITCITPRTVDADLVQELSACRLDDRRNAERFWERNAYAPGTRFVVVDFDALMISEQNEEFGLSLVRYERQWLMFWCAVVTFSLNEFSSNDLRAYHLYRLEVAIDEEELQRLVARHEAVWSAANNLIEARLAQEEKLLQRSEYEVPEIPVYNTTIHVEFDQEGFGGLQCDESSVGLLRDIPRKDLVVWNDQYTAAIKRFRELLSMPGRGLRKAVMRYRDQHTLPLEEIEYCVLSQRAFEELAEEQRASEQELVSTLTATPFEVRTYQSGIEDRSDEVVASIESRSSAYCSLLVIVGATLALSIGLVPGLLVGGQNLRGRVAAAIVALCMCATVVLVGMITIRRQRKAVRDAYGDFNRKMSELSEGLSKEGSRLGKRISTYATMQKRAQIIDRQAMGSAPTRQIAWLRERRARLSEQTELFDYLIGQHRSIDSQTYRLTIAHGWDGLASRLEDESFFKLSVYRLTKRPFNMARRHGGTLTVPFSFVSEVSLVPLSLYTYKDAAGEERPC